MEMHGKPKGEEEQRKFKALGSIYPEKATLQEIKNDRFRRETVAQGYFNDLSASLMGLFNLKNQAAKDVEVVVSSLELKKEACRQECSELERSKSKELREQKEQERAGYAGTFKENHSKMQEEYSKRKETLEGEKNRRLKEVREWFDLNMYALDPENHPKFYLTDISRSAGLGLSKSPNFEKDASEMEYGMIEEMVRVNNERGMREQAIEAQFSGQINILEEKYKSFMKEVIGKEFEVIRKLNQKYAEKEAALKSEISSELSIKLDSIDKLILTIRSKHDRAFHDIVRQEADLENEYRDNILKLADPRENIPESLASKYLYCPLKPREAPKEDVAEKAEEPSEEKEADCEKKEEVSETAETQKPKQKASGIFKAVAYSLALGGLVYFYPDLVQKKVPGRISKAVSDVYVHSNVKQVVVSHEAMKRASEFRLIQKQKANVRKIEYAAVQVPNSPLLETARGLMAKEKDEVHERLVKSGVILDIEGFLQSGKETDSRFLKEKNILASRISELSEKGGFLGIRKSDRKVLESILEELGQGDLSSSKKEKLLAVLEPLNEKELDRKSLKTVLDQVREIKESDDNVSDFEAWLSRTGRVRDSPLVPEGYARPVSVQVKEVPPVPAEPPQPKAQNPLVEQKKEVQQKKETGKKDETEKKKEEPQVQLVEPDVSEAFERVETKPQETSVQPQAEEKIEPAQEVQPEAEQTEAVSEMQEPVSEEHYSVPSSDDEIGFGDDPLPPGKERTIIMCGDRPAYIEHDIGATLQDNDPDFCE